MKKWVLLLLLSFSTVYAQEPLTAYVTKTWTVDTAREEAFKNIQPWINLDGIPKIDPNLIENKQAINAGQLMDLKRLLTVFENGNYSSSELCSLLSTHYNNTGRLFAVEFSSSAPFRSSDCDYKFPVKTYKYLLTGQLVTVNIVTSEHESFVFRVNGELFAHWVGDKCYNADGSSCGVRHTYKENGK